MKSKEPDGLFHISYLRALFKLHHFQLPSNHPHIFFSLYCKLSGLFSSAKALARESLTSSRRKRLREQARQCLFRPQQLTMSVGIKFRNRSSTHTFTLQIHMVPQHLFLRYKYKTRLTGALSALVRLCPIVTLKCLPLHTNGLVSCYVT